jgi:hypothetical protein
VTLHLARGSALIPTDGVADLCLDDIVGLFKDAEKSGSFTVRLSIIGVPGACVIGIADFSVILFVLIRGQRLRLR